MHCVDIDECNIREGEYCGSKDLFNYIRRLKLCINTQGGYECDCDKNGFQTGSDGKCEDIDECERGDHNCDTENGECVNLKGKFKCQCSKGYRLNRKTNKCEDIDECTNHTHNCDNRNGICTNLPGSFECSCKSGFELSRLIRFSARQKCIDINECERGWDDCDKSNSKCVNTTPSNQNGKSKYQCICNKGFDHRGNRFNHVCYNINECKVRKHACYMRNQVCVDEIGYIDNRKGFHCACESDYILGRRPMLPSVAVMLLR